MTIHGHTFAGPRGAVALLSAILLATATAGALPLRSDAAAACGGTANDLVGKFGNGQTGPDGSKEVATVTFSIPNTVTSGDQVTDPNGHTAWSSKGSGTFTVGPPLSWTESGTYTYNQNQQSRQGTYQVTFKATQDTCTTGTQVSSFTGTYTDPQGTQVGPVQTYTRQP
jgi:hypothetical protein